VKSEKLKRLEARSRKWKTKN